MKNDIKPICTFENFIVDDTNRFAVAAAQAVAQKPMGTNFNPLFIYGEAGVGKTHLLGAIWNYILINHQDLKILYVHGYESSEVSHALKEADCDVDVLLFDYLPFCHRSLFEDLFHMFDTLYRSRKQMVFASHLPPHDLLGFDDRLIARLAMGVVVGLCPPNFETRVTILKNKAILDGVNVDEGLSEVISFIAENIKSNVWDLESAFNRVVSYARFSNAPCTKALAKQILMDVGQKIGSGPSAKDVKKVVANYFSITIPDIDSEERSRALSMPRQIAIYLCRELTDLSFPKIANVFKKDYLTVHHAYKKIKDEIASNENLKNIINELTEIIQTDY